jgi:hypothetical protein
MRPIELIPETIDVTNNGPETLNLPFGIVIAPGVTKTVALYKLTGGSAPGAGVNAGGTSNDPAKLDPQTPVGTVVGATDPGPTAGIPIGAGAPRAGYTAGNASSANTGPVHISGDSPRQRLWNAICAAVQDNLASGKFVSAMAVAAGGTNYQVGDALTVVGGTKTIAATATVATLTGPAPAPVATVTLVLGGDYSVAPTSPAATTTNSVAGANCTLTLTVISKLVTLANQVVGSGQPNLAVGNGGGYFGADLDYETPWQKRTQAVDTGLRVVDGAVGFNAAPRGGAAVTGIIPR